MPRPEHPPLLRTNSFVVLIGDREIGFAEVSRLSSETDSDAPLEGRAHRFATVVLKRALTSSSELYDWRRHVVEGMDDRREVTIHQMSAPGGQIVNSWRLINARPLRWSGPTFNALANEIAFEELELAFDDLRWLEHHTFSKGG